MAKWGYQFFRSLLGKNRNDGIPKPLMLALDQAIEGRRWIEPEIDKLQEYRQEAVDREDEMEINRVDYMCDLVRWQLTQAADEGERRLDHIRSLDTELKRDEENERCKYETQYWFNNWAWTFDPRPDSILSTVPFKLFDFQEKFVDWLEKLVYYYRQDGLAEKSRDMGVSWCVLAWLSKQWLFRDGFNALVGSRKEEFVDKKGRTDTLLEKIRFQLRMTPVWMMPEGFQMDKHGLMLNIINPVSGAFIAGESSNEDFGRAGRYTVILLDEFASFQDGGYLAWTACSQSSRTKLVVSTPKGKLNKFADLRWNPKIKIRVHRLHWEDHPWKDERWYVSEGATMTKAERGQELDIDYEASQVGIVFPQWNPLYSVITKSEFMRLYGHIARDENGEFMIPKHWNLSCMQDWGSTEESRCVTTWATTPGVDDPLSDSVFLYRQFMAPVDSAPEQVGDVILDLEKPWTEEARMVMRKMSHERKSEIKTYELQGLYFEQWEPDFTAGIAQLRNYMLVKGTDPNPFRGDLGINGRSRLYLIVEDKQGEVSWDEPSKKWVVAEPENDGGFARLRFEIPMYHIPASEQGKPIKLQRPMKANDDAIDTLRQHAVDFFPPIAPLTEMQEREKALPPHLRRENIAKMDPHDQARYYLTRQVEIAEMPEPNNNPHWRSQMYKHHRRNV